MTVSIEIPDELATAIVAAAPDIVPTKTEAGIVRAWVHGAIFNAIMRGVNDRRAAMRLLNDYKRVNDLVAVIYQTPPIAGDEGMVS